jgi:hypothetical protein
MLLLEPCSVLALRLWKRSECVLMSEDGLRGVERYPFETTPPALHEGNWRTICLSGQIPERKPFMQLFF